jgi:acetylornithine deacetylase/succinyl-diaminopimelate desuccinylase-like protein
MRRSALIAVPLMLAATTLLAAAPDRSGDGEPAFRSLYKELVETNTSLSVGSCTLAAERMAAHLKAVGYGGDELRLFSTPEHPKDGGLVARLAGSDAGSKGILLLAHLDVVEAKRADWTRDPFQFIEEGGYFYGRGVSDDKAMAAIFTDLMVRLKQEGYKPKKRITLALTCGEESSGAFNGAEWLSANHKDWIDADFAINEGGGGDLDEKGNRINMGFEAAEKVYQDFQFESTNPGGHSSQPVPKNAMYEMAAALTKLSQHEFPVMFNDANTAYFTRLSSIVGGEKGAAMKALLANPKDAKANALLSQDKQWHSTLRTTCVATMIDGGHAPNALPQRVDANVNCRIFPGVAIDQVRDTLAKVVAGTGVTVTVKGQRSNAVPAAKMDPKVLALIDKVSGELYPGTPVLPMMTTGATDGVFTTGAGIPTYGVEGTFADPDNGNIHGLNERVRVSEVMNGRRFQYKLVKAYTEG